MTSSSGSVMTALQLGMGVCGLSVWGARLHQHSVGELLLLLAAHRQQLPLTVTLQVRGVGVCVALGGSCQP
jgi:hypothetical protein